MRKTLIKGIEEEEYSWTDWTEQASWVMVIYAVIFVLAEILRMAL